MVTCLTIFSASFIWNDDFMHGKMGEYSYQETYNLEPSAV